MLPDTRSEIALPLIVGDRVLGALNVQSVQMAAFDEASATVLQTMADQYRHRPDQRDAVST